MGMRVFNTLVLHGQLEPKQIADFIKREHKEARELLYRMFKAGYLQMQVRRQNSLCLGSIAIAFHVHLWVVPYKFCVRKGWRAQGGTRAAVLHV